MNNMNIQTLEVAGVLPSIIGMRNPMNSWHLSDSYRTMQGCVIIGKNDLDLATRLVKAGTEHCKFLRQIQVWADVNMPRYWWSEADTYGFGTKNSCSTMHKLFDEKKEIDINMFVYDKEDTIYMLGVVKELNAIRGSWLYYKEQKDQKGMTRCLIRAKQILPEGFLQLRTWNTNYAELMNMYHQRKNHRLKEEWVNIFCTWCESLPYFKQLCVDKLTSK